jgi:prepilin-type N-terminal cleavage/methylation domain-containing protein
MLTSIRRSLKQQKGFTFMELVIVIAIIGILAAIAVPNLLGSTANARGARIVADLRTIDSAIGMAIAQGNVAQITTGNLSANAVVIANLANTPTPPTGAAIGPAGTSVTVAANTQYQIIASGTGFRAALGTATAETF